MTLLVLAAHPDDEVLGCGGSIAKYCLERAEPVITIIFSCGENSSPITMPELVTQERMLESSTALNILGCHEVHFLGLPDTGFKNLLNETHKQKIISVIKKQKPSAMLTHSSDDAHPDHRAVANFLKTEILPQFPKLEAYTFATSMPLLRLKNRDKPKLYIDVSSHYHRKERAIRAFKSQQLWLKYYYFPLAKLQDKLAGLHIGCRYAEAFYKL